MIFIDTFLEALEDTLGYRRGTFIPKKVTLKTRLNAVKNYTLEVWCIKGKNRECISSISKNYRVTNTEEYGKAYEELTRETIKNILKQYIKNETVSL